MADLVEGIVASAPVGGRVSVTIPTFDGEQRFDDCPFVGASPAPGDACLVVPVPGGETWAVIPGEIVGPPGPAGPSLARPVITVWSDLPTAPTDGQEVIYDPGQAGVLWPLRYQSGAAEAEKWRAVGAEAFLSEPADGSFTAVNLSTWVTFSSFVAPLSGLYRLETTLDVFNTTGNWSETRQRFQTTSGTTRTSVVARSMNYHFYPFAQSLVANLFLDRGQTCALQFAGGVAGSHFPSNVRVLHRPVRVVRV